MRIILAAAVASCVLSPLAASAQDSTPATVQPASLQQDKPPLICHYYYFQGMVIRRPDCRTEQEWKHNRIHQQQFFREFQMGALLQHN